MTKCNKIDMIDYDVFNNENKLKDHKNDMITFFGIQKF